MLITVLWQQLKDCQNIYLSAVKKDNLMFFNVAHSSFSHLYLKKILQSLNTTPKDSGWNPFSDSYIIPLQATTSVNV